MKTDKIPGDRSNRTMPRRRWRAAEIGHLGERYAEDGLNRLALDLDRSPDAITSQARRVGLRSPYRHRRQARTRAMNNKSVNVRFFDNLTEEVAFILGYIWVRGRVKMSPRHVLHLRSPKAKEKDLLAVRDRLGSRHRVQRAKGTTTCEVCSSVLVQTLTRKYGPPPGRANPDPPLPPVPAAYVPDLARGLLVGTGSVTSAHITWAGTARAMGELEVLIRAATGVSSPQKDRRGKRQSLSWQAPDEVRTLSEWLRLGMPALAEDANKGNSQSSLPGAL
jgi:hypothetical protein